MTRPSFRRHPLLASAFMFATAAVAAVAQTNDPRATHLEAALAANQGNAAVQQCLQNESAIDEYQRAVMAVERSRDPKVPGKFNCSWIGASWQEVGPAACCSVFERDKSSNADAAWVALQQCGWRAEVEKRRPAYLQAANKCLASSGATVPVAPPSGGGGGSDAWRSVPTFDQVRGQIVGKDAFAVVPGGRWQIFDNAGRMRPFPGFLADRIQQAFGVLDDRAWLQAALTSLPAGMTVDDVLRQMTVGGPDIAKQFIWFGDTFVRVFLPNVSISMPVGREVASPSGVIVCRVSSEHCSVRGTINGGGDFIRFEPNGANRDLWQPRLIRVGWPSAPAAPVETNVRLEMPAAIVTADGEETRVIIDLAPNGASAVMVVTGRVVVRETTTGQSRTVSGGDAALVWPGIGVSQPVRVSSDRFAAAARPRIRGSIVLQPGQEWSGQLRLDGGMLPIEARLLYEKPAGANYVLEVAVNGRPVTEPVLNKMSPMRYADGRNYPYREPNSAKWMLFYSPDYAANNGSAGGGYEVKTDPGQAYRYIWNVAALTGSTAVAQVQFRNTSNPPVPLELRLLPAEAGDYRDTRATPVTPPPAPEPGKPKGGLFGGLVDTLKGIAKEVAKPPATTAVPPQTGTTSVPYGQPSAQGQPHLAIYTVPRILAHGDFDYPVVVQLQDGSGRPMYPQAPLTVTVTSANPNIVAMYLPNRPASTTLTLKPPDRYGRNGLSWEKVQVIAANGFVAGTATITATAPGLPGASATMTTVPARTPDNRSITAAQTAPAASVSLTVMPPIVETDRPPVIYMDLLDANGQPTGVDFGPGEWTLGSSNPAVFHTYASSGRTVQLTPTGPGQTQLTVTSKRPGVGGNSATLTVITPGALMTTEHAAPPPAVAGPAAPHLAVYTVPRMLAHGDFDYPVVVQLQDAGGRPMYPAAPLTVTVTSSHPNIVAMYLPNRPASTTLTLKPPDQYGKNGLSWDKVPVIAATGFAAGSATITATAPGLPGASVTVTTVPTGTPDNRITAAQTARAASVSLTVIPPVVETDRWPVIVMDLLDARGDPTGVDFGPGEWTLDSSNVGVFPTNSSSGRRAMLYPIGPGQTQLTIRPKRPGVTGSTATLTVISPKHIELTTSVPEVTGILIEAEDETESFIRPLSERPAPNMEEIGPAWRPPYSGSGDWYLATGGEFLKYRVNVPMDATYYVWVRDYVDRFQPRGVRRIMVEFDGRTYGTFGEVDKDAPGDRGVFGWHKIGIGVHFTAGTHTMTVTKEAPTTGAAILDAFYFTTNVNGTPPEPPADNRYTSVAPQPVQPPPPAPTGRVTSGFDFGESAVTGRISNIVTARDVRNGSAVDIRDTFGPDINPIHVWFRLSGFAPGTTLTSRWTYLGGAQPLVIGTAEFVIAPTNDYGTFSYELAAGKRWPPGEYRTEILLDGAVLGSAIFTVTRGGN